jgi:hypothetical protein
VPKFVKPHWELCFFLTNTSRLTKIVAIQYCDSVSMTGPSLRLTYLQHPLRTLTFVFVAWKAILLLIALVSPLPGYDTSTTLLDWQGAHSLTAKFVRWDAIYFTQIAQSGRIHEQQWAWGVGFPAILRSTSCSRSSYGASIVADSF